MDLIYPNYRCYPPAPNWYSLYAAAIVEPNFFLYSSRNLVVVLDLKDLRYYNSFTAAEDKVDVIAAYGNRCYTAGGDKSVRLWDFTSGSMLSIHNEHAVSFISIRNIINIDIYANINIERYYCFEHHTSRFSCYFG